MFDKVVELFNSNDGVLTSKQVEEAGFGRHVLSNMLKKGLIERIEHNTYALKNVEKDEYYLLQMKYPYAIFSYETALFFHGMLDKTPTDINVMIPNNYSGMDIKKEKNVVVHFAKGNEYNKGMTNCNTPYENSVRSYNLEKTICDVVKNDKMLNEKKYMDAVKKYSKKKKDTVLLNKYARMYNIESKLNQLMENK